MRLFLLLLSVLVLICPVEGQTMKRISERNTPAHQAALKFMRGVNLGNSLEYVNNPAAGGQVYTSTDYAQIRGEGFDHVRVPVAWHLHCGSAPDFKISDGIFARADAVMNGALAQGLSVMINLHHFAAMSSSPTASTNQFYAIWRQVAAHYANAPSNVAFELLNEPSGNATTAIMNRIYPEAIRQIRVTNPSRTIFVGPGDWNGIGELKTSGTGLVLPDNDQNLIAAVHCYDPYYFTHQGAEWALPDTATVGVLFPGPPPTPLKPNPSITHSWVLDWFRDYNARSTAVNPSSTYAFRSKIRSLRTWADYWGRPVHVGEFGCYERAGASSRVNFYREIRQTMDEYGLGWCMWDWKAGFHYMKNGRPDPPGMRDAIFPPIELAVASGGAIEFDGAIGKTYIIQKTESLATPVTWQNVSTQTLDSPKFSFPAPSQLGASGFYRVQWVK